MCLIAASCSLERIGCGKPQPVRMLVRRFQQVLLGAQVALERHDHFFADRVDRRIRDLREKLPEIVVQHPRLVGEAGQARVVPHRADRVAQLADQRQQHELHRFNRVAEGLHPFEQRLGFEAMRLVVRVEVIEVNALVGEPFGVGAAAGEYRASAHHPESAGLARNRPGTCGPAAGGPWP